jgi:hypothetical protein
MQSTKNNDAQPRNKFAYYACGFEKAGRIEIWINDATSSAGSLRTGYEAPYLSDYRRVQIFRVPFCRLYRISVPE